MRKLEELISSKDTPWKTEGAFWNYIRGGLRRGLWEKLPVKLEFIKAKRERVPLGKKTKSNPDGLVWGGRCETCGGVFKQSELQVDHRARASQKPLREDLEGFIRGLVFVLFEDLAIICKDCHKIKNLAEREGIPFGKAKAIKLAIAATKQSIKIQREELKTFGFDDSMTNNATNRRKAYEEYYLGQE